MNIVINNKLLNSIQWFSLIGIVSGRYIEVFVMVLICVLIFSKYRVLFNSTKTVFFLGLILFSSLCLIMYNHYTYGKFIQQYVLLFFIIFSYSQFFAIGKFDIRTLFEKYIYVIYILSILGLLQFVIYFLFNIDIFPITLDGYVVQPGAGRIMRIHSTFNEPGNLGTCLVPAITYILFKKDYFKNNKKKSIILFVTFLLTFATISYVLLAILLLVKCYTKLKYMKYIFIVLMLATTPFVFNSLNSDFKELSVSEQNEIVTMMQMKIVQTTLFFEIDDPRDFEMLNASSYATLTNLWVASHSPTRIIGTGLGTHQENYTRAYPPNNYSLYGLNSDDGYSLFIRIFSEFGFVGLILYFIFIIKHLNRKNVINLCMLFVIIALLIRGGHYTLYGTTFFHFLYYFTSKRFDKHFTEINSLTAEEYEHN